VVCFKTASLLSGLAIVLALAACAISEKPVAPPRDTPTAYKAGVPVAGLPRPRAEWWRELGSAELDRLEEAALANNKDLQVAIARVAQAQAQARVADAARHPTLDAFGRRELRAPADGPGSAATRAEWRSQNTYQLGLRANYEIDLWGRSGYAAESALALARASVHQRETVALTLTADVAESYLELLSLNERIAINARSLQNRRNSLDAFTRRARRGDATALEIAQQRVAVATAESLAASLAQRRERAFNRLAVLTGVSPAELKLESTSLAGVAIPAVDPGLPSELLCRRPDVRRAEAQLAAAQFDVHALRANLLPSFSLAGEIGFGARHIVALTHPASLFMLAAGSFAHSLSDAGRRESQLEVARARQVELVHQYSATLLTALREVEDALATVQLTQEQRRALTEAVDASRASFEMQRKYFASGAVDYFQVLDAEQKMVASEDSSESARFDRLRAAIDLYKSLGGGTRAAGDSCSP